jgi:hypothetical protein
MFESEMSWACIDGVLNPSCRGVVNRVEGAANVIEHGESTKGVQREGEMQHHEAVIKSLHCRKFLARG